MWGVNAFLIYELIIQKTATNPCEPHGGQRWGLRDLDYKVTGHRCEPVYTVTGMGVDFYEWASLGACLRSHMYDVQWVSLLLRL